MIIISCSAQSHKIVFKKKLWVVINRHNLWSLENIEKANKVGKYLLCKSIA